MNCEHKIDRFLLGKLSGRDYMFNDSCGTSMSKFDDRRRIDHDGSWKGGMPRMNHIVVEAPVRPMDPCKVLLSHIGGVLWLDDSPAGSHQTSSLGN